MASGRRTPGFPFHPYFALVTGSPKRYTSAGTFIRIHDRNWQPARTGSARRHGLLLCMSLKGRPGIPDSRTQGFFPMVIECNSCRARYWMKDSVMKRGKGARVRCRRCGVTFSVVTPDMVSGAPVPAEQILRSPRPPATNSPRDTIDTTAEAKRPSSGYAGRELPPARPPVQSRSPLPGNTGSIPSFPDNVYSLETFREARPKRSLSGGYDISGTIRPWPSASPVERIPEEAEPVPALPAETRQAKKLPLEEPVQWKIRGKTGSSDANALVPPGGSKIPELSPSDRDQFQAGFVPSTSAYKRVTDIAIVYLLLMILGGCGYLFVHSLSRETFYLLLLVLGGSGYLLVHFLSRMMN